MGRIEYADDPGAPEPNSLVAGALTAVTDAEGRVLLQRRADNGLWALPGGGMDMGESLPEAAVRETKEETGLDVEITGLVGMYTDPRHVMAYDDGEVRRQFAFVFAARVVGGELAVSDESTELRWAGQEELPGLPLHPAQRLRLGHVLEGRGAPYLG
ncbi:NUDIX domain-containing protein [Streptomyces sp. HNM0574]|uniref:NUDIX hydrolase n=1 Tax=Streptomyces sp. HNM0574 TaxID=2714954 RepID=UPI00146F9345|nr:NUDIX domain-containing protein [Streptomyces sp. HNM0574]NLU69013.1 NUDIX domain-containing protein [Streptomyces sp. HNM0574]